MYERRTIICCFWVIVAIVSRDAKFLSTVMQEFQHLKLTHKFVKSKIAAIANLNPTNKLTHVQKKRHILTWPLPQQNLQQSSFYICQRTNKGEVFVPSFFFDPKTPTADRVSRSRADMISISVKPLFFKL